MTKVSRWVGVFDILEGPFDDDSPIFSDPDPYTRRFKIKPVVWLDRDFTIPIKDPTIWNVLSFTGGDKKYWTGSLRSSCRELNYDDGRFLERVLQEQVENRIAYPVDEKVWRRGVGYKVRGESKTLEVSVPDDEDDEPVTTVYDDVIEVRESIQIQALIADIGSVMGFKVWVPRGDKGRVSSEMNMDTSVLLDTLPLNYDETTLTTIENIDVLWLSKRTITRAFEVEHSTSIYSGLLRMADLIALQPNLKIRLHIVAPDYRRDKVERELKRPVFTFLEHGPLIDTCTFLSYGSIRELSGQKFLSSMTDDALDELSLNYDV